MYIKATILVINTRGGIEDMLPGDQRELMATLRGKVNAIADSLEDNDNRLSIAVTLEQVHQTS